MEFTCGNPDIDEFALRLLRTSYMLCDLVGNLVDALPEDAFPGESQGRVVTEMVFGTIATAFESVDLADVVRASELIELAAERVIEHLTLAAELSRRMHGNDGLGRSYG
jgi:hypothetical protein